MTHRIMVIIVQYGNWVDTSLCIESLLAGDVLPDWIVIVDNNSFDGSDRKLLEWTQGTLDVVSPRFLPLQPPARPLPITTLSEPELETADEPGTRCVFVRMTHNRGYAAGNNVGMRLGLRWGADSFLILNNDTMVTSEAVRALRDRLLASDRPGLCGGLLRYCHEDQLVQCLAGGRTDPRSSFPHYRSGAHPRAGPAGATSGS